MSTFISPDFTWSRYGEYADLDTIVLPPKVQANLIWTGRDDYLEWVASWKACLAEKVAAIREQRSIRGDSNATESVRGNADYNRNKLRVETHNMFLIRKIAKRLSTEQREARLKLDQAA